MKRREFFRTFLTGSATVASTLHAQNAANTHTILIGDYTITAQLSLHGPSLATFFRLIVFPQGPAHFSSNPMNRLYDAGLLEKRQNGFRPVVSELGGQARFETITLPPHLVQQIWNWPQIYPVKMRITGGFVFQVQRDRQLMQPVGLSVDASTFQIASHEALHITSDLGGPGSYRVSYAWEAFTFPA